MLFYFWVRGFARTSLPDRDGPNSNAYPRTRTRSPPRPPTVNPVKPTFRTRRASGVLAMIQEAETGRRVPPAEMETCQEAISVAYALLQRHPGVFLGKQFDENDDDDDDDVKRADGDVSPRCLRAASSLIASLYRALQGSALSREAAVAAGVTVAAAVGAGVTDPRRHAAALADAFAERGGSGEPSTSSSADAWCHANGVAPAPMEALALATEETRDKSAEETVTVTQTVTQTVTSEINNTKQHKGMTFRDLSDRMTPFGRLCAARGVLTAASAEALSFPLEVPAEAREVGRASEGDEGEENPEKKKPWTLLTSYLFPYICASLERPGDSHHKYHAAAALRAALVRVKALAVAAGRGPREKKEKEEEAQTPAELKKVFSLDDVFPPSSRDRVCDILWANWEDPLSQTVKETHLSFDTLLDVEEARAEEGRRGSARTAFLEDAARSLLKKDVSVKGRYAPLAMVARRLGARRLLALAPDLLTETLRAMRDDSVCTAAGALVAAVAQSLLAETVDGDAAEKEAEKEAETASRRFDEGSRSAKLRRAGKDEGTVAAAGSAAALATWRAWWVGPLAEALLSPGRERAGAGTYALPAFLRLDGASVVPLLARIREDPTLRANAAPAKNTEEKENDATETHASRRVSAVAAAVVAVLRSARALGLLDPDDPSRVSRRVAEAAARTFAWETTSGPDDDDGKTDQTEETTFRTHSNSVVSYGVDASLLLAAATRRDARSRRDALDLLCADGKRASLPGALERKVLRSAIPTHLRDADPAFRSALVSSMTRLLGRIKAGCGRAAVFVRARPELARTAFESHEGHDRITTATPLPVASSETEKTFEKTSLPEGTRGARCFGAHAKGMRAVDDDEAARLIANASACVEFTEWLVKTLMSSAYPGAPYERKQTALDLLLAVAETFGVPPESSSAPQSASVGNREDTGIGRGNRLAARVRGEARLTARGFAVRDTLSRFRCRDVSARRRRGQLGQTQSGRLPTALETSRAVSGGGAPGSRREALRVGAGALALAPRARVGRGGAASAFAVPEVRAGRGVDRHTDPGGGGDAAARVRRVRVRRGFPTPRVRADREERKRRDARERRDCSVRPFGFFFFLSFFFFFPHAARATFGRFLLVLALFDTSREGNTVNTVITHRPLMLANIFSNMC
jgi:hypothetical protein